MEKTNGDQALQIVKLQQELQRLNLKPPHTARAAPLALPKIGKLRAKPLTAPLLKTSSATRTLV